jgi:hypothetical protein
MRTTTVAHRLKIVLVMAATVLSVARGQSEQTTVIRIAFSAFVTVQSAQLVDENGPMRFVSFNIPNLQLHRRPHGFHSDQRLESAGRI